MLVVSSAPDPLSEVLLAVGVDAVMVRSISPLARIRAGDYAAVPTFLIHPSDDDLVPLAQAQRVNQALLERGIDAQRFSCQEGLPRRLTVTAARLRRRQRPPGELRQVPKA